MPSTPDPSTPPACLERPASDLAVADARARLDAWLDACCAGRPGAIKDSLDLLHRFHLAVCDRTRAQLGMPLLEASCSRCEGPIPADEDVRLVCLRCPDPNGRQHPVFCSVRCCNLHSERFHPPGS